MKAALVSALLLVASPVPAEDLRDLPDLQEAIALSRQSLPLLLQRTAQVGANSLPGSHLLIALATEDAANPVEYLWISKYIVLDDRTFVGRLAHQPYFVIGLDADSTVHFNCSQVVDWSWAPGDGFLWGLYTARTAGKHLGLPPGEITGLALSEQPLPPDWQGIKLRNPIICQPEVA